MPVHIKKVGKKFRIVEHDGKIAMTSGGKPKDGGGHASHEEALGQMRAINGGMHGWKPSKRSKKK